MKRQAGFCTCVILVPQKVLSDLHGVFLATISKCETKKIMLTYIKKMSSLTLDLWRLKVHSKNRNFWVWHNRWQSTVDVSSEMKFWNSLFPINLLVLFHRLFYFTKKSPSKFLENMFNFQNICAFPLISLVEFAKKFLKSLRIWKMLSSGHSA